jgi:hypothetical protein
MMPTARMPGRPVVILLDTHRAWLVDTEAANDVVPDAERTFSPPPRRLCWACAFAWTVVLASAGAVAVLIIYGAHALVAGL